jgi:hypothetical protein
MPRMTDAYEWSGRMVLDVEGEEIGEIDAIYRNRSTDEPEWALVHTGLFGRRLTFVPLNGAAPKGEDVAATVSSADVKDAPSFEPGEELSTEQRTTLQRHYGLI